MFIGERLKAERAKRYQRQDEFAAFLGLSRDHYGRLERNEHEPHVSTVRKVAERLGVEPSDLADGD